MFSVLICVGVLSVSVADIELCMCDNVHKGWPLKTRHRKIGGKVNSLAVSLV